MDDDYRISRRASLVRLGGLVVATATGAAWTAATSRSATDAEASSTGPNAVASGVVSCVLASEQTEGPYYVPGDKFRRNVTEGRSGVPLTLKLSVVDVPPAVRSEAVPSISGTAMPGGVYSETSVQGTENRTFLRGIQKTDAKGVASFQTIYPGWYQGRTVHIHVEVALGGNVVHTGQLYFPDKLTDAVYKRSPYNTRPGRTTRNATDSIYRNGGSRSTLALQKTGRGYVGTIAMGVHR